MTKEEIFQKIKEILTAEFKIDESTITPDARLYQDLELDSIDAVDLLVQMKKYVRENIVPEQFKKAVTVQDVVDILYPLV